MTLTAVGMIGCNGGEGGTTAPAFEITGEVNDTGLLLCAADQQVQVECPQPSLPQQDAQLGRDAKAQAGTLEKTGGGIGGFDWTKLDASGNPLADQSQAWSNEGTEQEGTRWSCVQDNVTGLMWEIKESDPAHPRYAGHTYTWYFEDQAINGGNAGVRNGGTCPTPNCDTQGYREWLNSNTLCGHSDWRVPTPKELSSIAVRSKVIPAVDPAYFPNTIQPRFFTSQSAAKDANLGWYVYFSDGSVSFTNKSDPSQIRLVRGGNN